MVDNLKNSIRWQLVITLTLLVAIPVTAQTIPEQAAQAEEAIVSWFSQPRWSPYIAGAGIGILSWLAFLLSDHPLGCSTAYTRTSGMAEKLFKGRKKVEKKPYYQKFKPIIDWEWMLVVGVAIGSFISAWTSGSFSWVWVPSHWSQTFGNSVPLRLVVALIGGILIGFGSRWAQGCTSGHGLSGALQLAVSSWLALICFFAGGVVTTIFIFHVIT